MQRAVVVAEGGGFRAGAVVATSGITRSTTTARPRPTARLRLCRSVVETRGRGVVNTRGGSRVGHASARTARADSAPLTRKGDQQIVATPVAVAASESVGKDAASQIAAELLFDVAREWPHVAFPRVGEEGLEVIAHDAVQDRLGRPARKVRGGAPHLGNAGARASGRSECFSGVTCARDCPRRNARGPGRVGLPRKIPQEEARAVEEHGWATVRSPSLTSVRTSKRLCCSSANAGTILLSGPL
jgi:hypothetical protein